MAFDPKNHLTERTYALVLAGGRGSRLHQLTDWRAKPAVPFAGTQPLTPYRATRQPWSMPPH